MTLPCDPSTITSSPARIDAHRPCTPTTKGISSDLRMIAACDVSPPLSDDAGSGKVQGIDGREKDPDSDGAAGAGAARQRFGQTEERAQEAIADRFDVGCAFSKIRILHALERGGDPVDHATHRGLGSQLILLDRALGRADDLVVSEHQPVGIDDEAAFPQTFRPQAFREQGELLVGNRHRSSKTIDFLRNQIRWDLSIRDDQRGTKEARLSNGDAIGRRYSAERRPRAGPLSLGPHRQTPPARCRPDLPSWGKIRAGRC